ncbi:MAG: SagB/ThcOx family dehydrogenase [Candidatus Liptonbacteria bacterium]|nr:SagB/ThcOx family dehydrogenase [Candidatus Liptonbacteria bacterium]
MKNINFSKLFTRSSKEFALFPLDKAGWPEEWGTVYYKDYPRMPKVSFSQDEKPRADLFSLIEERKSQRNFSKEPITLRELSHLLYYSAGVIATPDGYYKRAHPSGGGRYPIETYLIVNRDTELKNGLYHYNPKSHSLDVLWEHDFIREEMDALIVAGDGWAKEAPFLIIMTATFWRSQNKYGERGLRFALLEAGHIGQNFLLAGTALGLRLCPTGGTLDYGVEKLLDIDGQTEGVVYAIAVGK